MSGHDKEEKTQTVASVVVPAQSGKVSAYLIVVASDNSTGRTFRLRNESMVLGRAAENDIRLDDPGLSRYHLRVSVRDDKVELVDLGSKNGLFYEGARIDKLELPHGEKFQAGSTVFKIEFRDEIEEKFQASLYESATRDSLTGLYNRRYFEEALAKDFTYCRRRKEPLSLVLFDIDHFKAVNDTHGHSTGDIVLSRISKVLAASVRGEDTVARIGGEEFAVLLRECPEDEAVRFADRLRREVEKTPVTVEDDVLRVTVSGGVSSTSRETMSDPSALMLEADKNLYRSKENGRNRVSSNSGSPNLPW